MARRSGGERTAVQQTTCRWTTVRSPITFAGWLKTAATVSFPMDRLASTSASHPPSGPRSSRSRSKPHRRASAWLPAPAPTARANPPTGHVRPGTAGAHGLLSLPPNAYRADDEIVYAHYQEIATAGLPVVAYNNPHDTKVDLTPALLARLHADGLIVAVKEFSGDVRRIYEINELAPELDVLVGTDDVVLELAIAGAKGWVAGYPNALPAASVRLWELAVARDLDDALPLYRDLHSLLRWDSKPAFVQAIKLSMDVAGRKGGVCRAPRLPLAPELAVVVRKDTEKALADGYR